MALNDRLKLRSLVVGEKGDTVYIASEECAYACLRASLTGYGLRAEASPL